MIPPPHIAPRPQERRHIVCYRSSGACPFDGNPEGAFWRGAAWSEEFVDIEGDVRPRPAWGTRVKMLWDEGYLYILAAMEEPHLWGTLTEHDEIVYHDNDFEVFLSPTRSNHEYYELEINALGTVFDLYLPKPYRDGGPADHGFDFIGLKKAVHLRGTLNDPRDTDEGWTVELAIPWGSLDRHGAAGERGKAPRDGEVWGLNFSRVQWDLEVVEGAYRKVAGRPEHNWVWSPQGVIDMHRPEMWGMLQFSNVVAGRGEVERWVDHAAGAREALHRVYYAQKAHFAREGRWAGSLGELGVIEGEGAGPVGAVEFEVTREGWRAHQRVRGAGGVVERWSIREDSLLTME